MTSRANPFFTVSALPYQTPPFDLIEEADFLPALEAGIAENVRKLPPSPIILNRPLLPTPMKPWSAAGGC